VASARRGFAHFEAFLLGGAGGDRGLRCTANQRQELALPVLGAGLGGWRAGADTEVNERVRILRGGGLLVNKKRL